MCGTLLYNSIRISNCDYSLVTEHFILTPKDEIFGFERKRQEYADQLGFATGMGSFNKKYPVTKESEKTIRAVMSLFEDKIYQYPAQMPDSQESIYLFQNQHLQDQVEQEDENETLIKIFFLREQIIRY